MAWPVSGGAYSSRLNDLGDVSKQIAHALLDVSVASAHRDTGRILVVEPRSPSIAIALREAGFSGELVGLTSASYHSAYDLESAFETIHIDDWISRFTPQRRLHVMTAGASSEMEETCPSAHNLLGTYDGIIIADLTRFAPQHLIAEALAWLVDCLAPHGCLALADPALRMSPEELAASLLPFGLTLATDARDLGGDWPRVLTLWRRRGVKEALRGGVAQRVTWERIASDPSLQENLATTYQEVFGGDEWGEWVKCVHCGRSYSRSAADALDPPGRCDCGAAESLEMYHSFEDILARLYQDLTPADLSSAYFRFIPAPPDQAPGAQESAPKAASCQMAGRMDGFSWGYLTDNRRLARVLVPVPAGGATLSDRVRLSDEFARLITQEQCGESALAIYYHAELGVLDGARSLSLTRTFFERGLRFATERGARIVVLRTSERSPVYRLLTGLGMQPIYWYDKRDQQLDTFTLPSEGIASVASTSDQDPRVILVGNVAKLLDIFATLSDTRLAVRIARGLREA